MTEMEKHAVFALIGLISFIASFVYPAYNGAESNFISTCLLLGGIIFLAVAYKIFNNISIIDLMRRMANGQAIIKKDTAGTPLNADYEIARDCLVTYQEALICALNALKNKHDTNPQEMATFSQELARISSELNAISPTDGTLINRAKYIYSRQAQDLVNRYSPNVIEKNG